MIRGRSRRFWWLASAAVAVLIGLGGYFLAISPQLSAATDAELSTDDLTLQNQILRADVERLEAVDVTSLRARLAETVEGLPYTTALPVFTTQTTRLAAQTGVTVESITIGDPAPVDGAAAAATSTDGGTDAGTATSTGLRLIPVTVTTNGLGASQRAFLQALQVTGPRRVLVLSTSLNPTGVDDGTVAGKSSMTTTLDLFQAPLDSAAQTQLEKLLSETSAS